MTDREGEPLRCFCASRAILAIMKLDRLGKPYVHIKVHKAGQVHGEILFNRGELRVRCRNCYRWHIIRIVQERAVVEDIPDDEDLVDLVTDPY